MAKNGPFQAAARSAALPLLVSPPYGLSAETGRFYLFRRTLVPIWRWYLDRRRLVRLHGVPLSGNDDEDSDACRILKFHDLS